MNDSSLIGILKMQLSSNEFSPEQKLEIIEKLAELEKEKKLAELEKEKKLAEFEKEIKLAELEKETSLFYNIRMLFTNNNENKKVH